MEIPVCFTIRSEVFIDGQGVPSGVVVDGLDGGCAQFIGLVGDEPAGSARLRFTGGEAKAERVAVVAAFRGRGLGVALMQAMEEEAARRGYAAVVLHAQESAIGFYEGIGYGGEGDSFVEADIVHRKMKKTVSRATTADES